MEHFGHFTVRACQASLSFRYKNIDGNRHNGRRGLAQQVGRQGSHGEAAVLQLLELELLQVSGDEGREDAARVACEMKGG